MLMIVAENLKVCTIATLNPRDLQVVRPRHVAVFDLTLTLYVVVGQRVGPLVPERGRCQCSLAASSTVSSAAGSASRRSSGMVAPLSTERP